MCTTVQTQSKRTFFWGGGEDLIFIHYYWTLLQLDLFGFNFLFIYSTTILNYIWIGIGAWEPWSQWDMTVLSIGKYSEWDNRLQNKWEFIFPFSFQETFEFFVLHHLLPGQARHQVQVLQGRNRKWRRRHQPHRRMPGLREGDAVQGKVPAAGSEAGWGQQEVHRHWSRRNSSSQFIQGKTITQVID